MDVEEQETLSDGTAGGIEQDTITFVPCKQLVDEWVLCSEEDIIQAWRHMVAKEHYLVEGVLYRRIC